ncbi:MAG: hypothetical protein EPO27_10555 [Betaproteobacteria bacterium]|nr:MAG: hypothetical protein EPO27_10555 [Betaproteobacteria bacterium]
MEFTALQDFFCEDTQSSYGKGLSYTVRPANAYPLDQMDPKLAAQVRGRCEALAKLVPQWIKEGKVAPGRPAGGAVRGG